MADFENGNVETFKARQDAIDCAKREIDVGTINLKRGAHIALGGLSSRGHIESHDCPCAPEVIAYKDSYIVVHRKPS